MKGNYSNLKIARVIRALRNVRGAKQIALANALHISTGYYSKLENGRNQFTIAELYVLAPLLNISMSQLFALVEISANSPLGSFSESDFVSSFNKVQQQMAFAYYFSRNDLSDLWRELRETE